MSSLENKTAAQNLFPEANYYGYGQKSAGLLGLILTSDGQVTALAYRRPSLDLNQPLPPMAELYTSDVLKPPAGSVKFRLTLAASKVGLLTIEAMNWVRPYEVERTHFLGMFNPYGADELPYAKLKATKRSGSIPPNRVFDCEYIYDPQATDPKKKAELTLTDVESGGQGFESISISSFDDPATGFVGSVFVGIRVNAANYADACATLEFTGGHKVNVPVSGTMQPYAKLTLNTTAKP